jgi:hypothetical protein
MNVVNWPSGTQSRFSMTFLEVSMQRVWVLPLLLWVLLLGACSPKDSSQASSDSTAPHATITLRDGTKLMGAVTSSTPTEITLNMDSGGTRTVLTKDVKSMDYGDGSTAATSAANAPAAPATPAADAPRPERVHPEASAIQTKTFVIPAGTEVSVRNDETIDSGSAAEGQTYAAEVTTDVRDANGAVVIPRGANAQLVIKSASGGGRIRGASDLVVDLRSISVGGKQYLVDASDIEQKGKSGIGANKRTGEFVGGGAALGAVIGAIAGQGKGAAIGAASGAGAGALGQILTKGSSVKIPAETLMTFKLDSPVKIVERK